MLIVNPIYDQAFKYLMENEAIAKKILSVILEEEIIHLQFKPKETVIIDKKERDLLRKKKQIIELPLSRYDFKAIIRTRTGEQNNVLIEIQKAKSPDPIMRFRKYLGQNYIRKETFIDEKGKEQKIAFPIITVYFLGYSLPEYKTPGIIVNNDVIDATTKQHINIKNKFVKLLTHPSYIIQINQLRKERKTRLEKFLSIFDQECQTENKYILDIEESDGLEEFYDILKYLNLPTQDEDFIRKLEYEEEIEDAFEEKDKALKEKDKLIEELKRKLNKK